ncbi:hypothetical protein O181_096312 [Austropuccinia psidii MF-1]|uniref:Uncharacterized protein n=1 Tax=Austropuccinia psidii MF-1 TaxID=1389203 RepID=A0A9Q3PDD5_9BASI|nr:hypothetical protein [Austropuccinia psidii MF-1]
MMNQQWATNTGAGLSELEIGMTLQEKLESMCPCNNCMDHVFGSKANVSAFSEMDTTKEEEVIELTDSDSNSDVEDASNSKSGLSAYEKSQRKAFVQHQEDIEGINLSRQHNLPKVLLD